jgi:predicted RNA methylase
MKLKQLQALLEDVEPFAKPKVALEQYVTGALQRRARWLLLC